MTSKVVRRLTPSDAPQYRELMLEAYSAAPEAFTSSFTEREALPIEWWATRTTEEPSPAELVYGAFLGTELVGVAGLSVAQRERTSHKATLFGMYVREPVRGQGVGRRLVHRVLEHARGWEQVHVIQLTVSDSNLPAIALYNRCGFVPFGLEPMAVKLGDRFIAKVHMWQPVNANAP
jgi:RimJ/RimL family protein N-acetyltransferase